MLRSLTVRLLLILLALAVGYGLLTDRVRVPGSEKLDDRLFPQTSNTFDEGSTVVAPYNTKNRTRRVHHVTEGHSSLLPLMVVEFSAGDSNLPSPPSPLDFGTVLHRLSTKGGTKKLLSIARLHWAPQQSINLEALETSLDGFDSVVLASDLHFTAEEKEIPYYFATLPEDQIKGSIKLLPQANGEAAPPQVVPNKNTVVGFSSLSTSDNPKQLLARWNDRVIPSVALLQILQIEGVPLSHVTVDIGRCIFLGDSGLLLPIDQFGSLRSERAAPIPKAVTGSQLWQARRIHAPITLVSPSAEASEKHLKLLAQLAAAPRTESITTFQRFPLLTEILILLDIAILCSAFIGLRPWLRHLCFLILLIALWPILEYFSSLRSMWMPSSAAYVTLITAWISSFFLSPLLKKKKTAQIDSTDTPPTEKSKPKSTTKNTQTAQKKHPQRKRPKRKKRGKRNKK